jgi:hypothetical protein
MPRISLPQIQNRTPISANERIFVLSAKQKNIAEPEFHKKARPQKIHTAAE